jgi:opacity protein-like surface antigen
MKNILIVTIITFLSIYKVAAQEDNTKVSEFEFGLKAGYTSTILKVKVDGISASDDLSGFYFGVFGDLSISEKFGFHSEVLYSTYSDNGENSSILQVPILAKYSPDGRLSLLAGPQFDYLLDEEDAGGLKRLGLGIALGASYDITDNVIIDARYSFGLSDRIDGSLEGLEEFNVESYFNYFFIGLGYRF